MLATKMLRRGRHHAASVQQARDARHVHSVLPPSRGSVVAHSKAIPGGTTRATQALHPEIERVLFSIQDIEKTLERLGSEIGEAYKGKNVVVLGVLKGGFMLTSDLVRHIFPYPASMEVDFIKASSYGAGTSTSGTVKLDDGFNLATLTGKHVLVVEDIVDSGLTLSKLVEVLLTAQPLSVRVCALLDKRARRKVSFDADYVGFECPDAFVVGYGIDYAEKYRYLPYIGTPKDEFIAKH